MHYLGAPELGGFGQSLIPTWSQFDCNHFSNQLWVNEFLSLASNDLALAYMRNRAIYRDKK